MKCVEEYPYPVLHVRPKSRPPTPDPYGAVPNSKKLQKLKKIAVKKSIRIPEPKEGMPLETLNLSRNGMSCQGFSAFLSCLARRGIQSTLLTLDISRTNIAVAGGRVLAQFLSKCLFIQKLDCRSFSLMCVIMLFNLSVQPHSNGRQFSTRIFACHAQQRTKLSIDASSSARLAFWNSGRRCAGHFSDDKCSATGFAQLS